MRVAVTGTPGTGKTSATRSLPGELDVEVVHLNEHVEAEHLYTGVDEARDSLVADLDGLSEWLATREAPGEPGATGDDTTKTLVVESHLAHLLPADRVVVLRCHPEELNRRLAERGVDAGKADENSGSTKSPRALARSARENAESEALDVILAEAVERHSTENVYEIDTTDLTPAAVGEAIAGVVAGERAPSAGTVSFLDYFE